MSNTLLYCAIVVALAWNTAAGENSVQEVQNECRKIFHEDFLKFGKFIEECFLKLNLSKADINSVPNFPLFTFLNEAKSREQEIHLCFLEAFPIVKDKKVNTELLEKFIDDHLKSPASPLQASIKTALEDKARNCPNDPKVWSCFWSACHLGYEEAFKKASS